MKKSGSTEYPAQNQLRSDGAWFLELEEQERIDVVPETPPAAIRWKCTVEIQWALLCAKILGAELGNKVQIHEFDHITQAQPTAIRWCAENKEEKRGCA